MSDLKVNNVQTEPEPAVIDCAEPLDHLMTIRDTNAVYDGPQGNSIQNNKVRELRIREVNRGFIVDAGCHTFAISTAKELTQLVTEYINDPSGTERKWFEGTLMKR